MDTYLTMLYVTLEQESALKKFFTSNGWSYLKPDLSVTTNCLGKLHPPGLSQNDVEKQNSKKTKKSHANRTQKGLFSVLTNIRAPDITQHPQNSTKDVPSPTRSSNRIINKKKAMKTDISITEHTENDLTNFTDEQNELDYGMSETTDENNEEKLEKESEEMTAPRKRGQKSTVHKTTIKDKSTKRKRQKLASKDTAIVQTENQDGVAEKAVAIPSLYPDNLEDDNICSPQHQDTEIISEGTTQEEPEVTEPFKKKTGRQKGEYEIHICDICGLQFRRTDTLNHHKKYVHLGFKRPKRPSEKCHICEVCGASFYHQKHLLEHRKSKHIDKPLPHKCKECSQAFMRPSRLQVHMNKYHLKEQPYSCPHCDKKFFSSWAKNNHITTVCRVPEENRLKCSKCDKIYGDKRSLDMHDEAIHGSGAFLCACGETVKWKSSVAKHKRRCKVYQESLIAGGVNESENIEMMGLCYNYTHEDDNQPVEVVNKANEYLNKNEEIEEFDFAGKNQIGQAITGIFRDERFIDLRNQVRHIIEQEEACDTLKENETVSDNITNKAQHVEGLDAETSEMSAVPKVIFPYQNMETGQIVAAMNKTNETSTVALPIDLSISEGCSPTVPTTSSVVYHVSFKTGN